MSRRIHTPLAALVAYHLVATTFLYANSGWKPESTWKQSSKDSVVSLIKEAETLEEAGQYKAAVKVYKKIEKKSSNMANSARAIVAQGRCLHELSDPWLAYRRYREAIDDHANFIDFNEVLKLEYEIAEGYFGGKRDKFLVFSFTTDGKAMEIYDHIATVAPYAPFTPDAIHKSGLISFRSRDYTMAAEKFRKILTRYASSPVAENARVDLAKTLLQDATEADGDETLIRQARRELENFIRRHPDHERHEEARELLKSARAFEAEKLLYLAEFYQRESHYRPDVSRRYLQQLFDQYEDTSSAEIGRIMWTFLPPVQGRENDVDSPAPSGHSDAL